MSKRIALKVFSFGGDGDIVVEEAECWDDAGNPFLRRKLRAKNRISKDALFATSIMNATLLSLSSIEHAVGVSATC